MVRVRRWYASVASTLRTVGFVLRVMPMLPSRWLDRRSPEPHYEQIVVPGLDPRAPAEYIRPPAPGPHAGVVVCLGVIPFDVTHPQVRRLGRALARRGFATLIVWSPAMRSLRIDPDDTSHLVAAFDWLTTRPEVDPARSGLLGTCVGGGFVLTAAAHPQIRNRVRFVTCFAPFGALRSLALDIGSETTEIDGIRRPWQVDQLSRHVYVRTLLDGLPEGDAIRLETAWFERQPLPDPSTLSDAARTLVPLLQTTDRSDLERLLGQHPALAARIDAVCPIAVAPSIQAPIVTIGHDRDDTVLPFGESQRLIRAFAGRPGVTLTEFHLFQHADPTKRRLSPLALLRELIHFLRFAAPALACADPRTPLGPPAST